MPEETQIAEQPKIFQLNSIQIGKIEKIVDDILPAWDSELQADVWNQFADKHNLVFVKFSDPERYSVRTKNGIECSALELNSKLDSLLQFLNKRNHEHGFVPRAEKSDGKDQSITFLTAMPGGKELQDWIKSQKKKDLKGFMNIYNSKSQELKPRQEGMTLDQYQTYLTAIACEFAIMHDGMMELSRKENKKIGALNAEKHKLHQSGLLRKSRSANSKSDSIPRIKNADLNPTQKLMKTLGMADSLIADMVEVKKFELEYKAQLPATFKINKTSSTETSFSERKEQ